MSVEAYFDTAHSVAKALGVDLHHVVGTFFDTQNGDADLVSYTDAGGTAPVDCGPSAMVGESKIGGECEGAISGLKATGLTQAEARADAIKMGLYRPGEVNESAALDEGTRFVRYADNSISVFDKNGNLIASMDCHGVVTDRYEQQDGGWIDSEPCNKTTQVVEEPKKVEEPDYTLPKVHMVKVLVDCPDGTTIETVAAVEPDADAATRFLEGQPPRTMAYYPGADGMLHVRYVGLSGKIHDMVVCDNGKDVTSADAEEYLKTHTRPIE